MDTSSPRWSLRLLGDFQLSERASGEKVALPGKRERVLLAYLALSPNGRQPRRKLVTLLWGEAADETTLENLRTSIFNLRKALGDTERGIIASEDRDIVLDTAAFQVDVLEFHRLAAAQNTGDLEEAAKLYAGDFLEGISIESDEFESWRREESTRCKGHVLDALTKLMGQLAASGESERAIETGLRILRLEPLHEEAVRRLMRLYAENGRRTAGVELYKTLAESLKKELGAQPETETRAVYGEITQGNDGRTAATVDAKPPLASPTTTRPSVPAEHSPAVSIARPTVNKERTIAWVAAGALAAAAAIAILSFISLAPSTTPIGGPPTVVAATPTSAIALAVLPFANLSTEPNQDFFSDGLTEEIGSALAKIPDLSVVARTSAFEFKGQNRNIRTIGEQLGATHLIEGSVRRVGNQVRVTAQLIQADNGLHLWTENYDRELTDIFAIQEDIARAIAGALRVPLGQGEVLVSNRTSDLQSYEEYLRGRALVRARTIADAIKSLELVVARNPSYAPTWAMLARAYQLAPTFSPALRSGSFQEARTVSQSSLDKSEKAAGEAIRLDSRSADGYGALAFTQQLRGEWAAAEDLYKQALALDPNDPEILHQYGLSQASTGRLTDSLNTREKLRTLEPFVPIYNIRTAEIMELKGQHQDAIAILEAIPPDAAGGYVRNLTLARAYAADGRYGEAANTLLAIKTENQVSLRSVEDAAGRLRSAPAKVDTPEPLSVLQGELSFVYAYIGALNRILEYPERLIELHYLDPPGIETLWSHEVAPLRRTERFKAYARAAGLVEYWRAKGWPDLCRPVGADDFVCSVVNRAPRH